MYDTLNASPLELPVERHDSALSKAGGSFASDSRRNFSIKFSLRRLLTVIALYAVYLALMRPLGTAGIVLACVVATSLSLVVLIARVKDTVPIVMVTVGALLGALLGWLVLQPFLLGSVYGYDHGFGESAKSSIAAGVIGVVGGSLAMSWLLGWLGAGREWRGGADATVEERGKSE